jgi:hypothetical protein
VGVVGTILVVLVSIFHMGFAWKNRKYEPIPITNRIDVIRRSILYIDIS